MKTRNQFSPPKSITVEGVCYKVRAHKQLGYFRIKTCNIPASSPERAIEKYRECQAKRGEK